MSTSTSGPAPVPEGAQAQIVSFVELSCYNNQDQLRHNRGAVAFRLYSVGKAMGPKLDVEFYSDYGLYYGGTDEYLIQALALAAPQVDWRGDWMFHRWLDQSRIQIFHGTTGRLAAQVQTRQYCGKKVAAAAIEAGHHGANVVTLGQLRQKRMQNAITKLSAERLAAVAAEYGCQADPSTRPVPE